jgi:hypothetical protein
MNEIWSAIGAISSAISTLVILVAAVIAMKQLREAAQARHVGALSKVFEDFHSEEARQDKRFIYDNSFDDYSKCSPEIRYRVDRVIELHQRTAFLATLSLIPSDLILEMYSGTYAALWQKLELYVLGKRTETGLTNYGASFEVLAKKAVEYRKKRFGERGVRYTFGYTPPLEVQPSEVSKGNEKQQQIAS